MLSILFKNPRALEPSFSIHESARREETRYGLPIYRKSVTTQQRDKTFRRTKKQIYQVETN